MSEQLHRIKQVTIEQELKQSYVDYAMSVIIGRALPDVRDGLKPVHRRVLYTMRELGNDFNKPYKKSARIVGDVMGKYHPHGDTAIYDTIVRMAQNFSMRYTLVDGQGNFGSVDGDPPAAMRYKEIRMTKLTHSLLIDLEKETVDFSPNYDGTETIPNVLPTRVPNLLVNGSTGIAVGMATNIPPHNLGEVIDACKALIENPDLGLDELLEIIPGPDFPTAGIINGREGIVQAYKTGKGRIYVRGRAEVEVDEKTSRETIIISELPYQVNKARLIEKVAELVKDKKIEGISEIRDESDKDGMRVVIIVKRSFSGEAILNKLYSYTQLQNVFGINVVALENGSPKIFTLKELLRAFLEHRREVVTRRAVFDLNKAREKAHVLEGLAVALVNIEKMIQLIKTSPNPKVAKERLLAESWDVGFIADLLKGEKIDNISYLSDKISFKGEKFGIQEDGKYVISGKQAQAILDLKLHRLTGLEQDKIIEEYKELLEAIKYFLEILNNESKLLEVIVNELDEIRAKFADERKTEIIGRLGDITDEDLVSPQDVVVTLSHKGYVKYQPLELYSAQRRGGKGKAATSVKSEDFVEKLISTNTLNKLMCFTSKGKVYWLDVFRIPEASRVARGLPIINLLPLEADEKVNAILDLPREYYQKAEKLQLAEQESLAKRLPKHIVIATQHGYIKRMNFSDFLKPRTSGLRAVELGDGDLLKGVITTYGNEQLMLISSAGKAILFEEEEIRVMGRTARGIRGIRLKDGATVIALLANDPESPELLIVSEKGYGKRTSFENFRTIKRGGQGVVALPATERNGSVVGAIQVSSQDEMMLISNNGKLVRLKVEDISSFGRSAQGVRLIRLGDDELLAQVAKIADKEQEENE